VAFLSPPGSDGGGVTSICSPAVYSRSASMCLHLSSLSQFPFLRPGMPEKSGQVQLHQAPSGPATVKLKGFCWYRVTVYRVSLLPL
jgi:hypothetical protein